MLPPKIAATLNNFFLYSMSCASEMAVINKESVHITFFWFNVMFFFNLMLWGVRGFMFLLFLLIVMWSVLFF